MKIPHITCNSAAGNAAASSTTYFALGSGGGANLGNATEANVATLYRSAGVTNDMWLRVNNGTSGGTKVCTFRKNGGAGNQTFTIPSSGTGIFQDASNTDSISAGDTIDMQIVNNSGTNQTLGQMGILFQDSNSSNTTNRFTARQDYIQNNASTTLFWPASGTFANGLSATEANAQFKNRSAATLKNLCILVTANTCSYACTLVSRINGGNGNLTITIPAGTTGYIEDTTHSDVLTGGELINLQLTTGSGTGSITVRMVNVDYITTNNKTHYVNCNPSQGAIAQAVTNYTSLAGARTSGTTETTISSPIYVAGLASNLQAYVSANSISATSTVTLRQSSASGNNVASIGSTVTGLIEDTTHTDSISASNNVDIQVVTGNSPGNITITMTAILIDFTPATPSTNSNFFIFF